MIQRRNNWREDEPHIISMLKSLRTWQNGNQNVKTHYETTQDNEKMSNTDPTKKPVLNLGAHEG